MMQKKFVELDESGQVIYQEFGKKPSREGLVEAPDSVLPGYVRDGESWIAPVIVDTGTYAEKRRAEYPPIGDQLDALMKWLATETEFTVPAELKSIAMKCMSVKGKYPK